MNKSCPRKLTPELFSIFLFLLQYELLCCGSNKLLLFLLAIVFLFRFKSAKYTVLTFPILNLFEQFRRAANFYFLVRDIHCSCDVCG